MPGTISANRATTVTYHWARSDQTSTGPTQVKIPAGGTVSVPDSVTAASNQWQITDTLVVTSPSAHSAAANVSVQCDYPTLTMTNPGTQQPRIDVPFSLSLTPSGGSGPYNWSQTGTLAPGLSFSGGVVTGAPAMEGRFRVTITVTDTEASPQTFSVSFIIDPLPVPSISARTTRRSPGCIDDRLWSYPGQCAQASFLPISSSPARARSSGVMQTRNFTVASNST